MIIKLLSKQSFVLVSSFLLIIVGLLAMSLPEPNSVVQEFYTTNKEVEKSTTKKIRVNDFHIEDRTDTCAEAIEQIYEDDKKVYSLNCIKSETIFLVFENGKEITLKEALENKEVAIQELIDKGLTLIIEDK